MSASKCRISTMLRGSHSMVCAPLGPPAAISDIRLTRARSKSAPAPGAAGQPFRRADHHKLQCRGARSRRSGDEAAAARLRCTHPLSTRPRHVDGIANRDTLRVSGGVGDAHRPLREPDRSSVFVPQPAAKSSKCTTDACSPSAQARQNKQTAPSSTEARRRRARGCQFGRTAATLRWLKPAGDAGV